MTTNDEQLEQTRGGQEPAQGTTKGSTGLQTAGIWLMVGLLSVIAFLLYQSGGSSDDALGPMVSGSKEYVEAKSYCREWMTDVAEPASRAHQVCRTILSDGEKSRCSFANVIFLIDISVIMAEKANDGLDYSNELNAYSIVLSGGDPVTRFSCLGEL